MLHPENKKNNKTERYPFSNEKPSEAQKVVILRCFAQLVILALFLGNIYAILRTPKHECHSCQCFSSPLRETREEKEQKQARLF